jgi:hypothetical protein
MVRLLPSDPALLASHIALDSIRMKMLEGTAA